MSEQQFLYLRPPNFSYHEATVGFSHCWVDGYPTTSAIFCGCPEQLLGWNVGIHPFCPKNDGSFCGRWIPHFATCNRNGPQVAGQISHNSIPSFSIPFFVSAFHAEKYSESKSSTNHWPSNLEMFGHPLKVRILSHFLFHPLSISNWSIKMSWISQVIFPIFPPSQRGSAESPWRDFIGFGVANRLATRLTLATGADSRTNSGRISWTVQKWKFPWAVPQ